MTISDKLEKLKNWETKTKIKIIEGDYELKNISEVDFPSEDDENMDDFLKLVENIGPKFLILNSIFFDEEIIQLAETNINIIEEAELEGSLKNLRKFKGEYLGFCCFIFTEGIVLRYNYYLEEAEDYMNINKVIRRARKLEESNYRIMPQEKVEEFGKSLAEHIDYAKLKNRSQRESLASQLFDNSLKEINIATFYGVNLIVSFAETFYETEIKPQKEKELKIKITEYLKQGWTKVKIGAELGISKDTVNKYV